MSASKADQIREFQLPSEEFTQIEKAAVASGEELNNWCRNTALTAFEKARSLATLSVWSIPKSLFAFSDQPRIQVAILVAMRLRRPPGSN